MSKITSKELERIDEPCRTCGVYASGRGKKKEICCGKNKGMLTGNWELGWGTLPDCPVKKRTDERKA